MRHCELCGKIDQTINSRSHSHIASKHKQKVNLQSFHDEKGTKQIACTKCIKRNKKK